MGGILNSIIYQPPPATYDEQTLSEIKMISFGSYQLATVAFEVRTSNQQQHLPILVFFSHGNAEDLGPNLDFLQELAAEVGRFRSCVVASYDYCGYGMSTGTPTEAVVFKNAEQVLEHMMRTYDVPAHRVILFGRSLGSGPTCHLAWMMNHKKKSPVGAVMLQSPLLSAFRVGLNSTMYYRLPGDQFCNYERVRDGFGENTKVYVIHGKIDAVVPFSHGKTIVGTIPAKNRYPPLYIEDAGHNDMEYVIWHSKHESLISHMTKFVEDCVKEPGFS